jgi:cytochrome P450
MAVSLFCVLWDLWVFLSSVFTACGLAAAYVLYPRHRKEPSSAPPFHSSYTSLGPVDLLTDPLRFIAEKNRELKTTAFSSYMLGAHATFISDPKDIEDVMSKGKAEICRFPDPYVRVIRGGFGRRILDSSTVHAQVELMKAYLTPERLKTYLRPSLKLSGSVLGMLTREKTGRIDLTAAAREMVFGSAIRNFMGDELLASSGDFAYAKAFDAFDVVKQIGPIMFPSIHGFYQRNIRPYDDFDRAIIAIVRKTEKEYAAKVKAGKAEHKAPGEYINLFEEVIARRHEKGLGSLTWADLAVLINFIRFVVFGTGFNTFNFVVYFFFWLLEQPVAAWQELREEQYALDDKYGADSISFEKINGMKKLRAIADTVMAQNCFPLLLRAVAEDFTLKSGMVVPAGGVVAFSPRMQHEAKQMNLTFGGGAHPCPAEWYSINSLLTNVSLVVKHINVVNVVSAVKPINKRLLTLPNLPPILIDYEVVERLPRPVSKGNLRE